MSTHTHIYFSIVTVLNLHMILSCYNLTEKQNKLINLQNDISVITTFIVPQHIVPQHIVSGLCGKVLVAGGSTRVVL